MPVPAAGESAVSHPSEPRSPSASLVYRFAAWLALSVMRLQRWRFQVYGLGNLPRIGGAVLATNHTSFWDFFTAGRAPYLGWGRPVRILAKESLFRAPVFGPIMYAAGHIPVHRGSGADALRSAVHALEHGELVLVLPEQTISPSFELLPYKTGAARMAAAAGVPLIPAVSWGSHRFHTSGRPPRWAWRLPVSVAYGDPLHPTPEDDPVAVTAELQRRSAALLAALQTRYPDGTPAGAWWVPARLGGSAPTIAEGEAHLERMTERWRRAAAARVEQAREAVQEGAEHARERLQEGAEHARERLQEGAGQVREGAEHARERLTEGAEQVREGAEHARERLQEGAEHLREGAEHARERLHEGSEHVREAVLERRRHDEVQTRTPPLSPTAPTPGTASADAAPEDGLAPDADDPSVERQASG
jgi:1-acyl-sn-glycerol-3-phosphate acyltransferase